MNDKESRRYDMFTRAEAFGNDYLKDLPPGSKGAKGRVTLAEVIAQLDVSKVQQVPPRMTSVEVLLDALLLDLKAIAKTARAIAQEKPGFDDPFIIRDRNPASLLTAADTFVATLKKDGVAPLFLDYEMPAEFVKNLEDDVKAIRESQTALKSGTTAAVGKTKAVGLLIAEGMKAVNDLDAVVTNKYGRNAEVMRAWQTASHIERAPKRDDATNQKNGTPGAEPTK
ncbi:MAG: hypothetical protein QM790_11220 [Nibricoccus sp.]